jgi:hypothetical protein
LSFIDGMTSPPGICPKFHTRIRGRNGAALRACHKSHLINPPARRTASDPIGVGMPAREMSASRHGRLAIAAARCEGPLWVEPGGLISLTVKVRCRRKGVIKRAATESPLFGANRPFVVAV